MKKYYKTPVDLDLARFSFIKPTKRVLDIGCGIRPQNYFVPQVHVCLEPHQTYIDILKSRYGRNPGFLILSGMAQDMLQSLPDKSFDSIFLIDVIEHLDKEDGFTLIAEMKRLARKQILIFTPLGFLEQAYAHGEADAWGLDGGELQEHRSGWTPEDFGKEWSFHICDAYHSVKENGTLLRMHGAFWAVYNVESSDHRANIKTVVMLDFPEGEFKAISAVYHALKGKDPDSYIVVGLGTDFNMVQNVWGRLVSKYVPYQWRLRSVFLSLLKFFILFFFLLNLRIQHNFRTLYFHSQTDRFKKYLKLLCSLCGFKFVKGFDPQKIS